LSEMLGGTVPRRGPGSDLRIAPTPPTNSAYIEGMDTFLFRFDGVFRPLLRVLGVHPGNSSVTLTDDDHLVARFGRWVVDTPLTNVDCAKATGPYHWYKAIGLRGSWVDQGITFGTTTAGGTCVTFVEPIHRLVPMMKDHPGLTVTVTDPDALVAAIEARQG
jgi:hypothetical protein